MGCSLLFFFFFFFSAFWPVGVILRIDLRIDPPPAKLLSPLGGLSVRLHIIFKDNLTKELEGGD